MNKITKFAAVTLILCLVCMMNVATAYEQSLLADTEFDSAAPTLLSSESVKFAASTYDTKASISVTACWLETYMNGTWIKVCNLTPPSHVATNTFYYSKTVSYASQIGSGTFRVWATFNADGHEITRCSNERTF